MPPHERLEGEFITAANEGAEQFGVGITGFALAEKSAAQVLDHGAEG